MHYAMTDTTIAITCTLREIAGLEAGDRLYATPNQDGEASQVYLSSQPRFRFDFVLAMAEDFLAEEGWTDTGWNEMTDDEQEERGDDETTITLPRRRSLEEEQRRADERANAHSERPRDLRELPNGPDRPSQFFYPAGWQDVPTE